ncbi:hypothetical protein MNBD_GAMMA08-530, partial [hydrothermal vent metagenome]
DYSRTEEIYKTIDKSTPSGTYEINNQQVILSDNGDIEISGVSIDKKYTNALHLSQDITLDVPFPEWDFFRGQNDFILRTEMNEQQWNEMKSELLIELQKIWDVVNSGNAEGLRPFLEARCLEYDQAFYTEPGENLNDFIRTINQDILDPEYTLPPIELKYTDISVGYERNIL